MIFASLNFSAAAPASHVPWVVHLRVVNRKTRQLRYVVVKVQATDASEAKYRASEKYRKNHTLYDVEYAIPAER